MTDLWDAHTSSIVYAMSIFEDELNFLESKKEQKFGVGWGHFVQVYFLLLLLFFITI